MSSSNHRRPSMTPLAPAAAYSQSYYLPWVPVVSDEVHDCCLYGSSWQAFNQQHDRARLERRQGSAAVLTQ